MRLKVLELLVLVPLQNSDHVVKTKLFTSFAKTNRTKVTFLNLHENNALKNTQTLISVCTKNQLQQAYQCSKICLAGLPLQVLCVPRLPWSFKKGNTFWGTADSRKPGETWNFNYGNSLSKYNK